MGDYSYQIYQVLNRIYERLAEILSAVNANGTKLDTVITNLETMISNLQTSNTELSTVNSNLAEVLLGLQNSIELLTLLCMVGFGVFAFYILLKWVKR